MQEKQEKIIKMVRKIKDKKPLSLIYLLLSMFTYTKLKHYQKAICICRSLFLFPVNDFLDIPLYGISIRLA